MTETINAELEPVEEDRLAALESAVAMLAEQVAALMAPAEEMPAEEVPADDDVEAGRTPDAVAALTAELDEMRTELARRDASALVDVQLEGRVVNTAVRDHIVALRMARNTAADAIIEALPMAPTRIVASRKAPNGVAGAPLDLSDPEAGDRIRGYIAAERAAGRVVSFNAAANTLAANRGL